MQSASKLFNESDRRRINERVQEAEALTSVEIVPVVATSSGRYDRAEDLIGLWTGICLAGCVLMIWPAPSALPESGTWAPTSAWLYPLRLVVAVIIGFMLGAVAGSRIGWLRRLFTPGCQMVDEVNQAARSVFFDQRIHHTQSGGGLLIYISLYERMAVVLADHQVVNTAGQTTLEGLCRSLTLDLRTMSVTDAVCSSIKAAGEQLQGVLPASQTGINELADGLITID